MMFVLLLLLNSPLFAIVVVVGFRLWTSQKEKRTRNRFESRVNESRGYLTSSCNLPRNEAKLDAGKQGKGSQT